jgi:hypothetical protein
LDFGTGTQSIKVKPADKKAALVELGKHLGLFVARAEIAVAHCEDEVDPRKLAMAMIAILPRWQASYPRSFGGYI